LFLILVAGRAARLGGLLLGGVRFRISLAFVKIHMRNFRPVAGRGFFPAVLIVLTGEKRLKIVPVPRLCFRVVTCGGGGGCTRIADFGIFFVFRLFGRIARLYFCHSVLPPVSQIFRTKKSPAARQGQKNIFPLSSGARFGTICPEVRANKNAVPKSDLGGVRCL
jgi:hypothetical protein